MKMLAEALCAVFVVVVIALGLALAGLARADAKAMTHVMDSLLVGTFCMFLFVAWFFEPWVVYLCGWEGLPSSKCQRYYTGQLWLFYAENFDPIFLNLPVWLRIVCSLDTLCFGPFYAISIYAFLTGNQSSRWYQFIALPFAGALMYSTIVYFAYEVLEEAERASLLWVFLINLPWTLAPLLLVLRLWLSQESVAGTRMTDLGSLSGPTSEKGSTTERDARSLSRGRRRQRTGHGHGHGHA